MDDKEEYDYHADGQKDYGRGEYKPPSRRFRGSITDRERREKADEEYNRGQDNARKQATD